MNAIRDLPTSTSPRLSAAEGNEMRAVYADPGERPQNWAGGRERQILLSARLIVRTAPRSYECTALGWAWLEANP